MLNKNLLKSKIVLNGLTLKEFVKKIGMNYNTFQQKLLNNAPFKAEEIKAIQDILNLTNDEVIEIFIN